MESEWAREVCVSDRRVVRRRVQDDASHERESDRCGMCERVRETGGDCRLIVDRESCRGEMASVHETRERNRDIIDRDGR